MAQHEIRKIIDQAAAAHRAAGDFDKAAWLEVAREYFTNPTFRRALEEFSFAQTIAA